MLHGSHVNFKKLSVIGGSYCTLSDNISLNPENGSFVRCEKKIGLVLFASEWPIYLIIFWDLVHSEN